MCVFTDTHKHTHSTYWVLNSGLCTCKISILPLSYIPRPIFAYIGFKQSCFTYLCPFFIWSNYFFKTLFLMKCVCVCVWACTHELGASRPEVSDPIELELQVVVSPLMCVLPTKLSLLKKPFLTLQLLIQLWKSSLADFPPLVFYEDKSGRSRFSPHRIARPCIWNSIELWVIASWLPVHHIDERGCTIEHL